MKQIRSGVFETNSSSTHSFTIVNKPNLVDGVKLLWYNLKEKKISTGDDGGFVLICETCEEKLSLIVWSLLSDYQDEVKLMELLAFLEAETGFEIEFKDIKQSYESIDLYSEDMHSEDTYFYGHHMNRDLLEKLLEDVRSDKIFIKKVIEW